MSARVRIALLVGLLVLLPAVWALTPMGAAMVAVVQAAQDAGPWGVLLFAVAFGVGAVFAVPASFGQMAAGFLYGPVGGFAVAWACSVTFAFVDFVLARTVLRDRVVRGWVDSALWQRLDERLATHGVTWVILLRMSPMSPFHVVSYALGCTAVRAPSFVVGTAVGGMPPVLLYSLVGAGITDLARLADGEGLPGPMLWIALGLTLAASVALSWRVRHAILSMGTDASTPE